MQPSSRRGMKSSKPWHIYCENLSSNLLKSDFAVINSVLAEYYEIEGVTGDQFRPVKLPWELAAWRFVIMAAVNLMGGNGEETSPVERGAGYAERSATARTRQHSSNRAPRWQGAHDRRASASPPGRSAVCQLPSPDRSHRHGTGKLRRSRHMAHRGHTCRQG